MGASLGISVPVDPAPAIRVSFRGAVSVELLGVRISARSMPADGEPIVGPVAARALFTADDRRAGLGRIPPVDRLQKSTRLAA